MIKKDNRAFTLVELSIVLVIIALILGGLKAGTALMQAGNVRSVITEVQTFDAAIKTFYARYNTLPGDMGNATDYWYNATTCPGTSGVAGSCNGNNDGFLEYSGGTISDESIRAWQHLNLAGLLPIAYTGIHTVAGQNDIGINVPASRFAPNGYSFFHFGAHNPSWNYEQIPMYFGSFNSGTITNGSGTVKPQFIFSVDEKVDDSLPKTGNVRGCWSEDATGYACQYSTAAADNKWCVDGANNRYRVSDNSMICTIGFFFISPAI